MPAPGKLKQVKDVGLPAAVEVERISGIIPECGTKEQEILGIDAADPIEVEHRIVYIGNAVETRMINEKNLLFI